MNAVIDVESLSTRDAQTRVQIQRVNIFRKT